MEALIIIDMLNDFVTGELKTERAKHIIPNIKKLNQATRARGIPVIYSNDAHLSTDSELKKWGRHALKGTKGTEVIPQLKPGKDDYVLGKRTYSGFFETGLDSLLREMSVDTIILTGLHANICVRHTVADGFFRGYRIVVPRDATETPSEQEYEQGFEYLRRIYNAEITETDEMVKKWSKR
ncbi:MAG: cysteine hydrolase [Candidatus Bathyarchaeota archaeon]|nr:MAG: cysteine hydrolase [Candidatus Bathyarchaeota archaeon]